MWAPRLRELAAVLLVGDGIVKLVDPRRHDRLWLEGPAIWRRAMRPLVESPARSRWLGAAMVAAGLWLASHQRPR